MVARLKLISIYFPKKDITLAANLEDIKLIFLRVAIDTFHNKMAKKIEPGSSSDKTICTTDLMATCAEILNIKLDQNEGVDSFSIVPLFSTKETYNSFKRSYTIHHSINGSFAIRKGNYKLIFVQALVGGAHLNHLKMKLRIFKNSSFTIWIMTLQSQIIFMANYPNWKKN